LRLIDDEEDEGSYTPFYDIPSLDISDEIGEFESLAFVKIKDKSPRH
jgi:hypothetical protein